MPYKDPEKQRAAMRKIMQRRNQRQKRAKHGLRKLVGECQRQYQEGKIGEATMKIVHAFDRLIQEL